MISKRILDKLNEQIKKEFYSSYLYLAMSTWCKTSSLEGFAQWLRVQAEEEHGHGMKILGFIEDRGGQVVLETIEQPPASFESVRQIFEKALGHERFVTKSINEICELSDAEKDYATKDFLGWFVREQIEEEANAQLICDKLKMIGDSAGSLLYLDKEMKKRKKEEE